MNTGRLRSSRNTFVCGLPVRAVTRQSIVRRSSPAWYGRDSSNSTPRPLYGDTWPPSVATRMRGAVSRSDSPAGRKRTRSASVNCTGDGGVRAACAVMSGHPDPREQRVDDLVRCAARRFGFEAEQDAMTEYVVRDALHVFRRHVVAAREPGMRARAAVERDRRARAR